MAFHTLQVQKYVQESNLILISTKTMTVLYLVYTPTAFQIYSDDIFNTRVNINAELQL